MALTSHKRLGEILCEEGYLDSFQLESALKKQKKDDMQIPLGKILINLGHITTEQLSEAILIQVKY